MLTFNRVVLAAAAVAVLCTVEGAPLNLYHNYFCPANNYTEFDFVHSDVKSYPEGNGAFAQVVPWQSKAFYTKIMQEGKAQGMSGTELDYQVTTAAAIPDFRNNVTFAADWLTGTVHHPCRARPKKTH